jgi:ribosomal protein S18 acetylase RimI-like enzyme
VTKLPDGFALRHTTPADITAAQALLDEVESAETGEPRRSPIDLAAFGRDPRVALETNTWLTLAPNGEPAGFAFVFWSGDAQGEAEPFVHPGYRGLGLEAALLETIESRAAELAAAAPPEARPRLHVFCGEGKVRRRGWLLDHGYRALRESYLMILELGDEPPAPAPLAPGIQLRPFVLGRDDAAVHAASEEAFADHFLHDPSPLDVWRTHIIGRKGFDPSLWLVAWDGDEVAGEALGYADPNEGYVDSLSVRRRWRGRGLGLSLLTHVFVLLHHRGLRKIRLGVDAQNSTGALAVYLKAGMRIERREEAYARDLR